MVFMFMYIIGLLLYTYRGGLAGNGGGGADLAGTGGGALCGKGGKVGSGLGGGGGGPCGLGLLITSSFISSYISTSSCTTVEDEDSRFISRVGMLITPAYNNNDLFSKLFILIYVFNKQLSNLVITYFKKFKISFNLDFSFSKMQYFQTKNN